MKTLQDLNVSDCYKFALEMLNCDLQYLTKVDVQGKIVEFRFVCRFFCFEDLIFSPSIFVESCGNDFVAVCLVYDLEVILEWFNSQIGDGCHEEKEC